MSNSGKKPPVGLVAGNYGSGKACISAMLKDASDMARVGMRPDDVTGIAEVLASELLENTRSLFTPGRTKGMRKVITFSACDTEKLVDSLKPIILQLQKVDGISQEAVGETITEMRHILEPMFQQAVKENGFDASKAITNIRKNVKTFATKAASYAKDSESLTKLTNELKTLAVSSEKGTKVAKGKWLGTVGEFFTKAGQLEGREKTTAIISGGAGVLMAGLTLYQLYNVPQKQLNPETGEVQTKINWSQATWAAVTGAFAGLNLATAIDVVRGRG